ncbi:hypothetical protein P691DRAFT_639464, partial [Macrolepiota fuliginosa MF-IS2]
NMTYSDNDDFPNHITLLCTKWAYANSLGATISNTAFKTIIFNSLPHSWDPAVTTLYGSQNSIDAISQLNVWQGHTIDMCYWLGKGKKRQFPLDFGKCGGVKGNMSGMVQGGYRNIPSANNISTTNSPEPEVFAL